MEVEASREDDDDLGQKEADAERAVRAWLDSRIDPRKDEGAAMVRNRRAGMDSGSQW